MEQTNRHDLNICMHSTFMTQKQKKYDNIQCYDNIDVISEARIITIGCTDVGIITWYGIFLLLYLLVLLSLWIEEGR